jgi:NitT/TauT family transport system substrate-binding protein
MLDRRQFATAALAASIIPARALAQAGKKARIGVLQTTGAGPMYIARDKGHFAREGLDAEIIPFDAAQPLAVSIAAGDLDFGATSLSAGFFNLAAQGLVRIIAAQGRDQAGFPNNGLVASNAAWDKGLRDFKDIKGHRVALPTQGSAPHYCAGLLAEKFGFQMTDMDLLFLKSNPNMVAGLATGQADASIMPSTFALAMVANNQARLIGWIGDITPWQLGAAYTSTKHADNDGDYVNAFLRAYRAGMRDYADAFISPDGKRVDGPTAEEMLGIVARGVDQPAETVRKGITYVDREARLAGKDVRHQILWHKAQGLVEGSVDVDALLDTRYVKFLPE